jgi:cyclophilin family peptidyl-prolyl cis-trans isomerase
MSRLVPRLLAVVVLLLLPLAGRLAGQRNGDPITPAVVVLETQKGTIEIETLPDAPKTVAHWLNFVRTAFYRGHRFHWVQPGVIQIGDPVSRDMSQIEKWGRGGARQTIGVEEFSKRPFARGIVGLAHTGSAKAASSQFFILRIANPALNGKYAVLGRVTKGMDVVDKIAMTDRLVNLHIKGAPAK